MQQGRAIGEIAGTADSQVPTPYQSRYAGIFSKPLVSKISKNLVGVDGGQSTNWRDCRYGGQHGAHSVPRRRPMSRIISLMSMADNLPIAGTADSMVPIPYHVALGPRSSLEESR